MSFYDLHQIICKRLKPMGLRTHQSGHVSLVIKRIDALPHDGQRGLLDYKTGSKVEMASWHKERLSI